jgi:hypothetical protein
VEPDEDKLKELLAEEGPNVPLGITGSLTGPRPYVSPQQAANRRMAMASALMMGISRDKIMADFTQPPMSLSESTILDLMREVRARWLEEDAESESVERAAAKRRLTRWIGEAAKAGKWTAVAALEKVHADITGNSAPTPPADTDKRVFEGVLLVLGETTPEEFRREVERERLAIDTEGIEVEGTRVRRSG